MSRRSNFLVLRRLGLFLAALGVLVGFGGPWPPAEAWPARSGDAGPDPSQVRLLPARSSDPARGPALLGQTGPLIPDGLTVLSPRDTPLCLVTLFAPREEASPTGSARRAALAWKTSVLNRIRLEAHAPPAIS